MPTRFRTRIALLAVVSLAAVSAVSAQQRAGTTRTTKSAATKSAATKSKTTKATAKSPPKSGAVSNAVPKPATVRSATADDDASALTGDAREIATYRLTMPVMRKMARVQENVYAMITSTPALRSKYAALNQATENEPEPNTLDEMVQRMERMPEMKRAITSAGLTTREYMTAMLSMVQAAMALSVTQMEGPTRVKELPSGVMADNVAFLKANKAELDRLTARTKELDRLSNGALTDPGSAPDTTESPRL